MLTFCKDAMRDITYQLITKEQMVVVRKDLQERFATGKTIPGTRSFHFFCPMNTSTISFKRTSEDEEFAGQFTFAGQELVGKVCIPTRQEFVACKYDKLWWIGVIEEINDEEQDCKVNFLHPPGPTRNFH